MNIWKHKNKIMLLLLIITVIILIRGMGWHRHLTFQNLKQNRDALQRTVTLYYALSVVTFIILYIMVTGFSVPGATILTLSGGFLFGAIFGTLYVNIGATTGATLAFLFSRYLIGDWVQKRYKGKLVRFNKELEVNGYGYLLTLRFIPLFPFFLINIFAGLTRISLKTFVWTTSVGILPGSFVYAFAGSQLTRIESPKDILSGKILLAFVLLGIFALMPVIIGHIRRRP
ncbi:MAG: TVP38/TMEM64 family protein [bacterium]